MKRKPYHRIFLIVLDSLGIGNAKDASAYSDAGANTLGHILDNYPDLKIPNLEKLGIREFYSTGENNSKEAPLGSFMRLNEKSLGKDTMTGHWEMMGLEVTVPFQTFTETGFPPDLIKELETRTGRVIVGNKSASGTEILEELAEEEIKNGKLIVYTSADSVLQICGHEPTMGLKTLYSYCEIARELTLQDKWKIGRVIARPYSGNKKGEYARTSNRHDYALKPFGKTVLDELVANEFDVISVGKISDIFAGEGITESHPSKSSIHGMDQTIEIAKTNFEGLCFTNLVDFDALWGHRRNVAGYAKELEKFDEKLGELLPLLGSDDLLLLTADHGTDPTFTGTDHTREQVPLLAYSKSLLTGKDLAESESFAVLGATIAENFCIEMPKGTIGTSILSKLTS